jgi:hypothetical protein
MGFFIFALAFYLISFLMIFTIFFIYFRLAYAVFKKQEVPKWIYNIGQGLQGRIHIQYDDITDFTSLIEASICIFCIILANIIICFLTYKKYDNLDISIYTCLRKQFFIALVLHIGLICLKLIFIKLYTNKKSLYLYSTVNAISSGFVIVALSITMCISISGFPAKPVEVKIDKTSVIIGSTKASELLTDGFHFDKKASDSIIVNKRNDHFYYGERVELIRDGKSYGFVNLTPNWKDSDYLKNCVITYYSIPAECEQLNYIRINNVDISKLNLNDFRTRKLTEIFSLTPVDYEEVQTDTSFILKIQTQGYSLWQSYRIEIGFNANDSLDKFGVRAQHTIWE